MRTTRIKCITFMDSMYYLLQFLNNWDYYKVEMAPLPESRKEKYNAIMEKYNNNEIDGRDVTCELLGWLANFDQESRYDFICWVAHRSKSPVAFIENHQIKYQVNFSGDELTVFLKCIKGAMGIEPLKESMKSDACKLYDRINKEWHQK